MPPNPDRATGGAPLGRPQTSPAMERDYSLWLGRVEVHAILPVKWGMLLICGLYWMWVRDWALPSTLTFSPFLIYGAVTAAEHFLFLFDRIAVHQVRPVVYLSYILDLLFITTVIWMDIRNPPAGMSSAGPGAGYSIAPGTDFYILYLLLVLRGFALFRTPLENVVMAGLISVLFIITILWQGQDLSFLASKAVILRLALIWAIMLLATFIVNIVNQQKEELLRIRERLVRVEGLASIGELAAGVAHEINNPIGIIKAYSEYLKRTVSAGDPTLEDFETIHREAERCERIVRRMMDFANPNVRSLEDVDVVEVSREVLSFVFHERADSPISAEVLQEGRVPPVHGDPGQIKQAILNVVLNARQILEKQEGGGRIEIAIRQLPGPRAPVQISVHDDGPGITAEEAVRAFEPFYTNREGGTGLGLAITRRIVEAHDGEIEIWPAEGGGTICRMTLPIAPDQ